VIFLDFLEFTTGEVPRTPLLRLSEKSLEIARKLSNVGVDGVLKVAKWRLWPRLDHLWEPRMELMRNFQTVSLGRWVNNAHRYLLRCKGAGIIPLVVAPIARGFHSPRPSLMSLPARKHPRIYATWRIFAYLFAGPSFREFHTFLGRKVSRVRPAH
jgi:hypothetical protein